MLQCVEGVVFRQGFVGQVGRGEQVLEWSQFFLDGVQVAQVAQVGAEILAVAANGLALPANLAGFRRQKADDHAQQAGLAGAILALKIEQFPRFQLEAEACEQAALAAHAFQIVSFKHQGKNRNKSVENYGRASVPAD